MLTQLQVAEKGRVPAGALDEIEKAKRQMIVHMAEHDSYRRC